MNFVHPSFLWALLVLAIPIIVHFFNFRRLKKVYFTNVRFLQVVKTETNSFKKVKELLILLSRLAFLAALVLAFAQPFFPSENRKSVYNTKSLISMYLDNSYSMQGEIGNKKHLDIGKENITDLLRIFPQSANFQLLTNDFRAKEQFVTNGRKMEDMLAETKFSSKSRDFQAINNRQISFLSRITPNAGANAADQKNQIFWFSDFQKSTAGNLQKLNLDTTNRYYLVPIKSEKAFNVAIDSVWLNNPFVKELENSTLNFTIHNYSDENIDNKVIKLFIDELQISTASVSVPAQSKINASFNFVAQGKGTKKGRVSFEDFPIVFDNDYFFTVQIAPIINILSISQSAGGTYIRQVYAGENTFRTFNFDANNLDIKELENADLVVLSGLTSISGDISKKVQDFVRSGGSVAVFPSSTPEKESYNEFLKNLGIRNVQTISKTDSLGKNANKVLLPPDMGQPFFRDVFEQSTKNISMPYANAVISWVSNGATLLSFKNSRPFLTQANAGRGKAYLFASPLEQPFSDLAKNAIFVPIMYKIASQSKKGNNSLSYNFKEKSIRLKIVALKTKNPVFKLVKPNQELIPSQRLLGDELFLDLPEQTLEAGYYDVVLDGKVITSVAFNYGKEESEMGFYSTEELKNIFSKQKNVQIYESASKEFVKDFKDKNIGVSLWKYFVVLALIFILAEILLIRFLK